MTRVLVPSLLLLASVGFAADASPAPAATAPAASPAIDMTKVSAPVTEGMKKITARILMYSKGGSLSEAGRKDIAAKIVKMDDDVTTPEDSQWIVSLLVQQHFVPENTDYPTLLEIARNGGVVPPKTEPKPAEAAKKEEPKPVAKTEEKPAATPAAAAPTAPAAPAAPTFVPGVKVKLYTYAAGTEWPPKEAPKFPVASLDIPALTDVLPHYEMRDGVEVPNRLIEHNVLDAARYYAVSYSGFIYAKKDGPHGLTVESDDPYVVYFGEVGKEAEIGRSDWYIKNSEWTETYNSSGSIWLFPKEKRTNQTVVTTPDLTAGRYYYVRILASQHWKSTAKPDGKDNHEFKPEFAKLAKELTPVISGATLKVRWIAPDSEPAPIRLYQPETKRVKRDE